MSDEKNAKKNEASLEEGEHKPMERRSFLKKIGIAGGAALAHFFVIGKPSTAFGQQDSDIIDGGAIQIRSRCRPGAATDRDDACFINGEPKEVGDLCYIRRTSDGLKEIGDDCQIVIRKDTYKLGEVGDKCTPIQARRSPTEVEVGDECETIGNSSVQVGDRCFQGSKDGRRTEVGDICEVRDSANDNRAEIGDICQPLIDPQSNLADDSGDFCQQTSIGSQVIWEFGDECFINPSTSQEFGDECDDGQGIGDTQPGGG